MSSDRILFRGSAFARRRREREIELESDEKDRQHEREEIEALRLNMMKKQVEGTEPENEEVNIILVCGIPNWLMLYVCCCGVFNEIYNNRPVYPNGKLY